VASVNTQLMPDYAFTGGHGF